MKVAVIYWSATGNTKIMAESIAEGVNEKGGNAEIFYVSDFEGNIEDYDLIALGCPAMGAEELEEYEFRPFFDAEKEKLKETNVVLFGSYDWGNGEWMDSWKEECIENGINVTKTYIANNTPEQEQIEELKQFIIE